jgi:hypothetical protein
MRPAIIESGCAKTTEESIELGRELLSAGIVVTDWQTRASDKASGKISEEVKDRHITVELPHRNLPGRDERATYVQYYRTADGKPANQELGIGEELLGRNGCDGV